MSAAVLCAQRSVSVMSRTRPTCGKVSKYANYDKPTFFISSQKSESTWLYQDFRSEAKRFFTSFVQNWGYFAKHCDSVVEIILTGGYIVTIFFSLSCA